MGWVGGRQGGLGTSNPELPPSMWHQPALLRLPTSHALHCHLQPATLPAWPARNAARLACPQENAKRAVGEVPLRISRPSAYFYVEGEAGGRGGVWRPWESRRRLRTRTPQPAPHQAQLGARTAPPACAACRRACACPPACPCPAGM